MMILYFKNLEANKLKAKSSKLNRGFTYVELIVVLGIFAVMSAVVIYNYGEFQSKVDIKSLASDIASKIVEAQKSSLNGLLPATGAPYTGWKPSYGVYFDISPQKQFIYFVDLSNPSNGYDGPASVGETLDPITITKNNYISRIDECNDPCTSPTLISTPLSITFKRPDSSAIFSPSIGSYQYIQITIQSPKTATALIKIYPSGRIQVN